MWLEGAEERIRQCPSAVHTLFPAVGRMVGRAALYPQLDRDGLVYGSVEDRARCQLLVVLADSCAPARLPAMVGELYRHGDDAERRGVLRGLPLLPRSCAETGVSLVRDALRSNDTRLVAVAMGRFAAEHLGQHEWRHGVLKVLFMGIPVRAVAGLRTKMDAELSRMVEDFAEERRAAGRPPGADAEYLLTLGAQC
ncbi:EboA domain-containing protein [Sciscionella sediminilitoris]|uniref:EboA domain-containing protein n=1 Tax=Sciscionella sediminilitoris TaxID=1445613 RepID=UPI000B03E031